MLWKIGFAILFYYFASPTFAHEEFILDSRRPMPNGIRLELIDFPVTARSGSQTYRLQTIGLPQKIIFGVYTRHFAQGFHKVMSGFHADEKGNVISNQAGRVQRLDEIVFEPGPYPRGAALEVALVSSDYKIRAFAKVFPRPITAHDNGCSVSLELIWQRGDRFVATGNGFAAEEELVTESRYAGRVIQNRLRVVSPEGLLPAQVLQHGSTSADRSARYTVEGRSCKLSIDYQWGEPALSWHY